MTNPAATVRSSLILVARLLAVLSLVALVVWVGWMWLRSQSADDGAEPVRVFAVAATRTLEDSIVSHGTFGFPQIGRVTAAAGARVTAVEVTRGDRVGEGAVLVTLDGRPMVAVLGEVPFWRDLQRGAEGDDVARLQTILADAGFLEVEADGRFGSGTEEALKAWQASVGMLRPDGILRVNDMAVGPWPALVGSVSVEVGDFVTLGQPVITLTRDSAEVRLDLLPSDRARVGVGTPARIEVPATGARVEGEVVDVAVVPVEAAGSLSYPASVAIDGAIAIPEGASVRVTLILASAEDVLTIPVAAVTSDGEGRPMVRVEGSTGVLETRTVELGIAEGPWVEVRAGLVEGDRVLIASSGVVGG